MIILIVLIGLYTVVTMKTTLGHYIYAMGGNTKVAIHYGIIPNGSLGNGW